MIKFKKEKKKDFVCDGCGKGYIGASRNSFVIRVAQDTKPITSRFATLVYYR